MKIPFKQIESFVKTPDKAVRVILVYGPDDGLMRERAKTIGLSVVKDYNDPFNVAVLSTDLLNGDPTRLNDEAGAISMMGGDRLVRVEDAGDKLTVLIKDYLKNPFPQALVILEAGELGPRSSLRKLCEAAKNAAAIPCYIDDERDLARLIREAIPGGIDQDAVSWLAANISGNRMKVRSELEKIITYKGDEKNAITLADVQACCGEAGARSLDDLVYNVGKQNAEKALQTYNQLLEEGVNFVVILRSLQNHFRRLHITKAHMETGMSSDEAMKFLQPPVFFKQEQDFRAQAMKWPMKSLDRVLNRLMDLEAQCKQTNAPAETLCAQAVLSISASKAA
jgi:DNA polymerase III subunit delta